MQCNADETGGQFLTASNADELDLAMTAMVMEPAPEPEPTLVSMTFTAVIGAERNAMWETRRYTRDGNPLTIPLPETPGDYLIQYFIGQDRISVASRPLTIE